MLTYSSTIMILQMVCGVRQCCRWASDAHTIPTCHTHTHTHTHVMCASYVLPLQFPIIDSKVLMTDIVTKLALKVHYTVTMSFVL